METFEAGWREHYDWRARQYANEAEAAAYSDRGLAVRMQTLTGLLQRLPLPAAPATLDIGCATGAYARALRTLGHRVVGVDYAFSALARARSADARTPYLAGDAYALPFADAAFDAVVCMGVLQLVARAYDLLAEASRVLRPGGVLVTPLREGPAACGRRRGGPSAPWRRRRWRGSVRAARATRARRWRRRWRQCSGPRDRRGRR
jgi:SAM-dependent methyltransferase